MPGLASIVGYFGGAAFVRVCSADALAIVLGVILIGSAFSGVSMSPPMPKPIDRIYRIIDTIDLNTGAKVCFC